MDNVIADFDGYIVEKMFKENPDISLEDRSNFHIRYDFPKELEESIKKIYLAKGFFESLNPLPDSLDALEYMQQKIGDIFICTSPITQNPYCLQEKSDWINRKLGPAWVKKTIMTKDKTIIHGDILIDDKPSISGLRKPTWEHILYDQPYNRDVSDKKRLNWTNFKDVLNI